ncbi:sensor histidine kinase [Pectinatus cerevisiiphilus]|uniref:histidine kinase n=1 Tax=Pectinatus cerevisiiphilus TaxID=86956 RepID=A0A4R3K677_9FIRM|nr:sensor histidine kinase [Pectinatus cerevisiiphilus]TCS78181.1 signal transduction histidine kinase [Pectinatus cerevisiiphilus]
MHIKIYSITVMHYFLYIFNAIVVFFLAGFMSITQTKINISMSAHSFLSSISAPPFSASEIIIFSSCSFSILIFLSTFYRRCLLNQNNQRRYILLALEICACLIVMRSINMAYDGVILLVVADLVSGYRGKNQRIILTVAMLGLYLIASYNLIDLRLKMIPLDAYISYYDQPAQGILKAACNIFTSFNMIIFVIYMMLLVQNQHQEKERIQSLNEQLNTANEKLRNYAIEAERMAETRERNRLAREIHDTLGHALTSIIAGLDACLATIDAAPAFTKKQLQVISDTARNGINDVRRSVKKLRPDNLERLPLKDALYQMIREFSSASGMQIELQHECWPQNLREDEEEVIYRIVQESITNANRHGKAAHILITLTEENNWLKIIIKDDGTGCENPVKGFGLRHMQERLMLLHGALAYEGHGGFTIKAAIPLNRGDVYNDKNNDSG